MLRNRTGELVVKPRYSPWMKLFVSGLIVIAVIATGGAIYNYGLNMAGSDRLSAYRRHQQLQDEIRRLHDDNQELRTALARAQRDVQMGQTTYQELDNALKTSAQEIVKLREELSFYRNIISPANKISGLQIQSFNVEATGLENLYRYKLVLIQAMKHDRAVFGRVQFAVTGAQDGKSSSLNFPQSVDKPVNVNFKYFQDIEGNLRIPKNFIPLEIKVSVITTNAQTVEQTYSWPQKKL